MRLALIVVICLGTSCLGFPTAQEVLDIQLPSEVTILKYTWTKSTPRTAPFSTTVANTQEQIVIPELPPGVTILKVKWETYTNVTTADGSLTTSPDNPNRLPLPGQSTTTTVVRTQLYVYSMELTNNGPKPINALAWDFTFTDAANKTELRRQSLANLQKIDINQKKTLKFTTQAAPPRIVSAAGLEKNQRSPFTQSASIRCLLFTDGSVWEQPKSKGACIELQRWIERRKTARPGVEDLPLKN